MSAGKYVEKEVRIDELTVTRRAETVEAVDQMIADFKEMWRIKNEGKWVGNCRWYESCWCDCPECGGSNHFCGHTVDCHYRCKELCAQVDRDTQEDRRRERLR